EDRLDLAELLDSLLSQFTVAVAALLDPAKGQVWLRTRRAGVNVDQARLYIAHRTKDGPGILREDGAGEAVDRRVSDRNGLFVVPHRENGHRGAKDLLVGDAHAWRDIGEDRRRVIGAAVKRILGQWFPTGNQRRPLACPNLRILVYRAHSASI